MTEDINFYRSTRQRVLRSRPIKILFGVIVFLIVLFIGFFIAITLATAKPKQAANDFLDSCLNSRTQSAYQSTLNEFQNAATKSQFDSYCKGLSGAIASKPSMYNKYVYRESGRPSTAVILYKSPTKSGKTVYMKVILKDSTDGWRVYRLFAAEHLLHSSVDDN